MKQQLYKVGIIGALLLLGAGSSFAQQIARGSYKFTVTSAEWNRKKIATCTVKVFGDSVKVLNDGSGLEGKKGDVLWAGILARHIKTRQWIICSSPQDIYAEDIGGCTGGPYVLDFVKKILEIC